MKTLTFISILALLLGSCGGSEYSSSPEAPAEGDTDQPATDRPVELTDELLEQYVAIAKEAKAAGESGGFAFLAKHRWSMERWMQVSATVAQGLASAGRAQVGDAAASAMKEFDQQIADAEAQLKSAPAGERAALQMQIDALKSARAMAGGASVKVSDLDRRNAETLKRWLPRLEEVNR